MSCHGCSNKFTVFKKENGCPNCGFSFCSKCLKFKTAVPKLGSEVCKVCISCYTALSESDENAKLSKGYCPPESFLKKLESLENPSRPPITVYRQDQRMQQLKVGLNEVDREIVERLEKLREERKQQPVPTEEEVIKRLAILRGEDPAKMAALLWQGKVASRNFVPPDTRTNQEKAENLVQQFFEERELDTKVPDAADEIAQRLAKLRGQDKLSGPTSADEKKILSGSTVVGTEESHDSLLLDDVNAFIGQLEKEMRKDIRKMKEMNKDTLHFLKETKVQLPAKTSTQEADSSDEEVEKTIQKALDEAALEEKLDDDSEDNEKEEELSWCIICNENATIRCIDCDNDLYCKSCYAQGHDEWQLQHHRTVPFTPKE